MNLIDMDRLRKELMAKGDIPIHEVFNTIWDQPIVNICEVEEQQPEDYISRNDLKRAISELTFWHPTTDGRLEVGGAFDNTVYKVDDVWRLTRLYEEI